MPQWSLETVLQKIKPKPHLAGPELYSQIVQIVNLGNTEEPPLTYTSLQDIIKASLDTLDLWAAACPLCKSGVLLPAYSATIIGSPASFMCPSCSSSKKI